MKKDNKKIYTGIGDNGKTRLRDGSYVQKYNKYLEAYGSIDELISFIGYFHDMIDNDDLKKFLIEIIDNLMKCCYVFSSKKSDTLDVVTKDTIKNLELEIDRMQNELPDLKNFLYPIGHPHISFCHVIRTICRRTERNVSKLKLKSTDRKNAFIYINRLSDYFFVLARKLSYVYGIDEKKWKKDF